MIDLIKGCSPDRFELKDIIVNNESKIITSKYYESNEDFNEGNKDEYNKIETQFQNLNIKVTDNNSYIENSIHTYFNKVIKNEAQNYDDLSFCNLKKGIEHLEFSLGFSLDSYKLQNLEFGFNIDIGSCPTKFIEENILMYKLKEPCVNHKNDNNKKQKIFVYTNYKIKIYDKSLESKIKVLNPNILRIEVKYLTSKEFNKFGVYNINDLKNLDNIKRLFLDFMVKFENLTIIDSYKGSKNTEKKEAEKLIKYTNPNFWIDIRNNKSNGVSYHKKVFNSIIKRNSLDKSNLILRNLIFDKFSFLSCNNCDCSEMLLAA